jgi:NADPH-dependent glutamate synthase beta subunit-like oxidoreductase
MMNHKEWRDYEEKCIQERPPACETACPVHVEARSFVAEMKAGNFNKALAVFRKTVPFPGIIGRICDHPCESSCRRGELGDAISIAALEKACVQLNTAPPAKKITIAAKKNKQVAVVGGGLSGVSAAFELAVKGYHVVIFEATDRLGGSLWDISEGILPREVLQAELGVLATIGVEIRYHTTLWQTIALQDLQREFDAVYLGVGKKPHVAADGTWDQEVGPALDPLTFATNEAGVFAGGGWRTRPHYSPVVSLSDGRRAATSIDRYLQGVSLTAVRDNEGSYPTRLYTNIEGIEPLPVVVPQDSLTGYTREEAIQEAGRCIDCQCMECVKQCEYLEQFKAYPKVYARQINQNLRIVKGLHGANQLINSCTLCGLCKEVCPEDFDMPVLIREARTDMVSHEKMPPAAHAFPIAEMEFSNREQVAFTRHQKEFDTSRYAFFPGCQLSGSAPHHVEQAYDYLTEKLDGGVGMMQRCCGAPAEWAGRTEQFAQGLQEIKAQWQEMGQPKMVVACSTCYQTFKNQLADIEIVSLWELYDQYGLPAQAAQQTPGRVAVHDACTTRYETQIHESVRHILKKMDFTIEELQNSRETTECCGYGGLVQYANRELAADMAKRRVGESAADYVAYCAMCRDNLAAQGKKTYHLLDLIYGEVDLSAPARRGPSYSQRRVNKVGLNNKMRNEIWGERVALEKDPYPAIPLKISEEVERIMEARLILEEDIQRVINHAEQTGEQIINHQNGHILANYRPTSVTFWVEYSKQDDVYVIHNTYSHRMVVEGNH